MRLRSRWVSANTAPTNIEIMATAHMTPRHAQLVDSKPTVSTRNIPPNAATLVQEAMKAVTGVGAPWYTSGVHEWNGPTDPLNNSPIAISPRPANSNVSERSLAAAASAMSASVTEPA